MASPLQGQQSTGCRKTCGKGAMRTQILVVYHNPADNSIDPKNHVEYPPLTMLWRGQCHDLTPVAGIVGVGDVACIS